MSRYTAFSVLALLFLIVGCNDLTPKRTADPSLVIAEDRLGPLTFGDLDRFVLSLPPNQRWRQDTSLTDWYTDIARRVAVERLLYEEAVLVGADQDPRFQALERRIMRSAYVAHFLSQLPSEQAAITETEQQAFYDAHPERFDRPERRLVFHIFKRIPAGADSQPILTALAQLRERAMTGESFELLAREHSDSETRHADGRLGFVQRGHFSQDFDRIVFGLEAGTPSEPIEANDGAHLFLVSTILEAQHFPFAEVQQLILQELAGQRLHKRLAQAAQDLPRPDPYVFPDRDQIVRLVRTRDPAAVLLQVGDFRLNVGQHRALVADQLRQIGPRRDPELPFRVLDEIRQQEIIYQHLQATGLPDIPQQALQTARRKELVDYYSQRKLQLFLEHQPERLQGHFDTNRLRFASPPKVHIQRLSVPLGDHPPTTMARLEAARQPLDDGQLSLADLAQELDGQVTDLGLVSAAQLQAAAPLALRFAFLLEAGEHSPPYRFQDGMEMFQVVSRQEPVPRPLALIRERVAQDYVANYGAAVFSELTDSLLTEADFRLYPERLADLGPLVVAE